MSDFNELERSLESQISNIRKKIDSALYMNEELRIKQKTTIERDMQKLNTTFINMQQTARNQPDASVLMIRVTQHRHEINQLERDVARVVPTSSRKIEETFEVKKLDQRSRLLDGYQRIEATSSNLNATNAIAKETEQIGEDTLSEMARQRSIIEAGTTELEQVDSQVDRIRGVLTVMGRRLVTDKFILAFIIVLLLAAIAFVIGWKWIRPLVEKKS